MSSTPSSWSSIDFTRPIRMPFLRTGVFGPTPGACGTSMPILILSRAPRQPAGRQRAVERRQQAADDHRGEHDDADAELHLSFVHGMEAVSC